jgi:hypothetical protein
MATPVSTELRRTDSGTLWPSVWAYEDHLMALGYAPQTVARRLMSARHVTVWLAQSRIAPTLKRGRFKAPDKLMAMLKRVGKT